MKTIHLSEQEIQTFALDANNCSEHIMMHMNSCNVCRAKALTYKLIFDEIKLQPEDTFDFDLNGLVMQQLPVPREKRTHHLSIIILLLIISIAGYLFKKQLAALMAGLSLLNWLIISAAVLLFIWLLLDVYLKFQTRMKMLDSAFLQH